jgi:hypothetical protein
MELYDVMTTTFASRDFTDEPPPDAKLTGSCEPPVMHRIDSLAVEKGRTAIIAVLHS